MNFRQVENTRKNSLPNDLQLNMPRALRILDDKQSPDTFVKPSLKKLRVVC
jgi:hypothetical protein